MTFPGESVRLDSANPISGTFPGGWAGAPIVYRRDGTSTTISSGAAFIAGFSDYQQLPSAVEPVVASVVIVTGAATSGTLAVSVGTDQSFDLDDPGLATQGLGSHAVNGAQTLVLPVPAFDVAAFYTYASQFIAYVQVTAGSVEFEQVRLRLWPPGGIAGAWVPGTATTALGGFERIQMAPSTPVSGDGEDVAEAYADAVATWSAGGPLQVVAGSPGAQGSVELDYDGVNFSAVVTLSTVATWVGATGIGDPVLSTPESVVAHPDEVPGEAGALVADANGNPVHYGWGGWAGGSIKVLSYAGLVGDDPATPSAFGVVQMNPGADAPVVTFDGSNFVTDRFGPPEDGDPIAPATATGEPYNETPVTLPSTPTFRVNVASYSWYDQPLDNYTEYGVGAYLYSGAQFDILEVRDLEATLSIPTHYIWDPEATPEDIAVLRLRQRGDGLGMGGPRLFGRGSRQRSPRARGYL